MTQMLRPNLLSIVVPCFNEDEVIRTTHQALMDVLDRLNLDIEIVYVDDGSSDRTADLLRQIQAKDSRVQVILLARNFGHQLAVTAGMDAARGDAVVLIDADLQDPPEVISQMVDLWIQGYDVVYGQRTGRDGETAFKLATAKWFYRVINWLSDTQIPEDTGDFRLMDRKVVDALKQMPEHDRFIRGMVSWVGFRQTAVLYHRVERLAGASKYPLGKMLRFATDGIVSFSMKPLRFATTLGVTFACFSVLGVIATLVASLFTVELSVGWSLMFCAIMFFSSVQLLCTGTLGEYVGRIYLENKRRPLYLVREHLRDEQQTVSRPKPDLADAA